jgi:hypothetical protein
MRQKINDVDVTPEVRRNLNHTKLCVRLAQTLGNRAAAERLEALMLADCNLEEANRVAASDERRH